MVKSGAVCIAASTRRGTIHNRHGLDINEILAEQQRSGELFPLTYTKGDHLTAESLLELEVDILVPAARSWAIHNGNVNGIRASIIPCAANAAMDLAVERKLFETGKIVVTDFVANCGGVFGSLLERYLQPSAIRRLLETNYYEKVTRLLKRSLKEGRTIGELAIEEATAKLRRADSIRQHVLVEFGRHILPFVPDILRRPALQRYCEWKFFRD
jgi:glutamate dehydrogenase/leucine dehydrogenase